MPVKVKVPVPAFVTVPVPLITPSNCALKLFTSPITIAPLLIKLPDPDKLATVSVLAFMVKVAPLFIVKDLIV